MKKYKLLLMDLDGILWRGNKFLDKNIIATKKLLLKDYRIVFMTNNATRSRKEYYERIVKTGISVDIKHIYTSAYLLALYVVENGIKPVFVIGESGLYQELISNSIPVISDAERVGYVAVGLDRYLTYNKLAKALKYLMNGALFLATNTDPVYPVGNHLEPGAGAIVNFLSTALGRGPDFIAGKPNTWIIDVITSKYDVSYDEILIIGDSIYTDLPLGLKKGIDTLLVLTGITNKEDLNRIAEKPTYVVNDLSEAVNTIL